MSRDTHKRLFNCEQDNKAETSTNSCPTNIYRNVNAPLPPEAKKILKI